MKIAFIKIVDKYIIKEISKPFLMGIIIITIIMLSSFLFQLSDLIIIKKIPISTVAKLLLYQLPQLIVQTFPIAVLFATTTSIGTLSKENEFTALRMGGVSLYRLMIPLIIFGIIISIFTYIFNEEIVPWSTHEAKMIMRENIIKEASPEIKEDVFLKGPQNKLFYVREYNKNKKELRDIVIYDLAKKNKAFPDIIIAQEGIISEVSWELKNGLIHEYDNGGKILLETQFNKMEFEALKETEKIFANQKTTDEMNRKELEKEITLFQRSGINISSLLVDYHLKLAIPFTPFIFIFLGVPLSLNNKKGKGVNILLSIVIIFSYYLILSLARSFGKNEMLPPLMAAWLTNIFFTVIGVFLLMWKEQWQNIIKK
ncbi:MAG: LptF/LptG family permease [bacterium]